MRFPKCLIVSSALVLGALAQSRTNPFVGRWDFNIATPSGTRASWLGISEKEGNLEVWFQPTGGNVYRVKDAKLNGSHLTLTL
ncbi:MAG TPA: DUF1080 domain-containing protein, partial [Bryobacteraceae bacterium]|nr:DUF1080 domain-containing protein [Bryobacteraceae bacterium]